MNKVAIPTTGEFLGQWHAWIHGVVKNSFKRDFERVTDMAQNARLRLLQKDAVARWFFKHMLEELVSRDEAERMLQRDLGKGKLKGLSPIRGRFKDKDSLWQVSDILSYANFDRKSYFYSIQNHLIDSDEVLELLGYEPGQYSALQALYRIGKLRPSELTDHNCCRSEECDDCRHGRQALKNRSLSLAHDWSGNPEAKKLRWNDSQLKPLLRNWNGRNMIYAVPSYIVRDGDRDITAGLLRYMRTVIENEVTNNFKSIRREEEPLGFGDELSTKEVVAITKEEDQSPELVFKDSDSLIPFISSESSLDTNKLLSLVSLTEQEQDVIRKIYYEDMSANHYAKLHGLNAPKVGRINSGALNKLQAASNPTFKCDLILRRILSKYNITQDDIFGHEVIGVTVLARAEFFSSLYDNGFSVEFISKLYRVSEDIIVAGINRFTISESRAG